VGSMSICYISAASVHTLGDFSGFYSIPAEWETTVLNPAVRVSGIVGEPIACLLDHRFTQRAADESGLCVIQIADYSERRGPV
jgi:hypothetical protein